MNVLIPFNHAFEEYTNVEINFTYKRKAFAWNPFCFSLLPAFYNLEWQGDMIHCLDKVCETLVDAILRPLVFLR